MEDKYIAYWLCTRPGIGVKRAERLLEHFGPVSGDCRRPVSARCRTAAAERRPDANGRLLERGGSGMSPALIGSILRGCGGSISLPSICI